VYVYHWYAEQLCAVYRAMISRNALPSCEGKKEKKREHFGNFERQH